MARPELTTVPVVVMESVKAAAPAAVEGFPSSIFFLDPNAYNT